MQCKSLDHEIAERREASIDGDVERRIAIGITILDLCSQRDEHLRHDVVAQECSPMEWRITLRSWWLLFHRHALID